MVRGKVKICSNCNWWWFFSSQVMSDFATPCTAACQASFVPRIFWSLPKFMSIASVKSPNHCILRHPLHLPSVFPSIRFFSSESAVHIRWPNVRASTSASASLMNIQGWLSLRLAGLILLSKKLLELMVVVLLLLSHFSRVWLCVTPSLGFSRQEHRSGLPFPSPMHESEKWKWSRSVMSDSSRPHGLHPTRLLPPGDFPGKSTGVGCHCLLHWWW